MLNINKEIFDYSKDLELVKGLFNAYRIFLTNPSDGIKAVNSLVTGDCKELFANIEKGLNGEFTKAKAMEIGISAFKEHIAKHINIIKDGVHSNSKLLKEALDTIKKNSDIISNTQDTSFLKDKVSFITKDLVRKEYAEHKLTKIIPSLLNDNEFNKVDASDVLCRLTNNISKITPFDTKVMQTNIGAMKNNLKLINADIESENMYQYIDVPTSDIKSENIDIELVDLLTTKSDIECSENLIEHAKLMVELVNRLYNITNEYTKYMVNYNNGKQDITIERILDKAITIADNKDYTLNELNDNIMTISVLLDKSLLLDKSYTIYLLNGYIDINNFIRINSKYNSVIEKIISEIIF